MEHQQDQQGPSQLQDAASPQSLATSDFSRSSSETLHESPPPERDPSLQRDYLVTLNQPIKFNNSNLVGTDANVFPGEQVDRPIANPAERTEFDNALSYVNKVKYQSPEKIYKQFLEIMKTYRFESKSIQEVYAQLAQLFKDAPDLFEGFKHSLPKSAQTMPVKYDIRYEITVLGRCKL